MERVLGPIKKALQRRKNSGRVQNAQMALAKNNIDARFEGLLEKSKPITPTEAAEIQAKLMDLCGKSIRRSA